jgi:hypothetical protein
MDPAPASVVQSVRDRLVADGFAFAPHIRDALAATGDLSDWGAFEHSWNDLAFDHYLADHGRFRRRRHAVFSATGSPDAPLIARAAHQPHYQSREYNTLQGGIERWFEPITTGDGPSLHAILRLSHCVFSALAPAVRRWRIETHQFRIEARADEPGQPTPEGVHRDGVDYVLVLLIRRTNIAQGTTTIHALDGGVLGSFTLTLPFDAAFVDDRRVYHGVTPVEPLDPAHEAHRDVLVVTFAREP